MLRTTQISLSIILGVSVAFVSTAHAAVLVQHLDASSAGSITVDGSNNITAWNDISSNNWHVQNMLTSTPVYDGTATLDSGLNPHPRQPARRSFSVGGASAAKKQIPIS
jgi:hypothetical protein